LIHVKASLASYKQIEVKVDPKGTVGDLKRIISKELQIEPELTKLLIHGKPLSDKSRISKLGKIRDPVTVDYLWARHLIVWGLEGQRKIRSATALLAGAGAIGNEVGKNLAMLGVGRLFIVDRDRVEMSNISRMIFFEPKNFGANKAEVLARNLHQKYPYTETAAFRGDLQTMPLKFYLDSDVVVCGLDNVVSRIYLTQICRRYSIPMIDGGITGLNARVHSYIPPNDPCPICAFPPSQYSKIAGLHNPCDPQPEQGAVPSFATSISLVSSLLSQETIKLILGREQYRQNAKWPDKSGQPLRSILFIDLKNNRYTPMDMKRNEKCYVCGSEGTAKETVPRSDLQISSIRGSKEKVRKTIRVTAKAEHGTLVILSETSHGEASVDGSPRGTRQLQKGDYLRVLSERDDGEFTESIIRLT
jgi:molybdopterin/thiamine biosynthesis adenylyltransferase